MRRGYTCCKCKAWSAKEYRKNWQQKFRDEKPDAANSIKRKSYKKHRRKTMREIAARKRGFVVAHTRAEWQELKAKYGNKCLACGSKKDITRDHVICIKDGGTDHIINIQPLCRSCNSSKGVKHVDYRT